MGVSNACTAPGRLGAGMTIEVRSWPDGAAAEVYVIDAEGNRVANPQVKEVVENGKRAYEIRMPSDNFAVLVKK